VVADIDQVAHRSYAIGKDTQVDAMLVRGLNSRSPDWSVAFGFSIRRYSGMRWESC
jgi:hypothetical protein